MLVIMRPVVRFTALDGGLEFIRQRSGPFLPGEISLLGKLDGERKRLCLPRLGKRWPVRVVGQARQLCQVPGLLSDVTLTQGSRPTG